MPVGELQERMTSAEFADWRIIYRLEPFGDRRRDLQAGLVATAIYRVNGVETNLADYLIRFSKKKRKGEAVPADPARLAAFYAKRSADLAEVKRKKQAEKQAAKEKALCPILLTS